MHIPRNRGAAAGRPMILKEDDRMERVNVFVNIFDSCALLLIEMNLEKAP